MNYLPVLLLPAIFFLCFWVWRLRYTPLDWVNIESQTGVFDLRDVDFASTGVTLNRNVQYIPDEMLTPEEFARRDDIQYGIVPDGTKVCTMRIQLLLNDDMQYGIIGYSVNYASSVFINGKWLFDEGKPGFTAETEKSTEAYRVFSAQPVDGVLEILIQTSSFSNIDTSSSMGWSFGQFEKMRYMHTRFIGRDIVIIAFYIMLAVVAMLLFMTLPAYYANGSLALLAFVHAIRTGLKNTKILLTLFPYFDWPVVYKTEKMTDSLTVILLTVILQSAFPGALPRWLRYSSIGIGIGGTLLFALMPWKTFLGSSAVTNQIVFGILGVLFLFILWSLRKERPTFPQVIILAGIGLVLYAFIADADYFANWKSPLFDLPFSITQPMFIVFTMFMLVATILTTMQKTTEQEVRLAQMVEAQKAELMDARVSTMLSQIQPHFLYNALSAIGNLCYTDAQKTHRAIVAFANYLRTNMDSLTQKELIPFAKELEHTRQYLWLEQLRFEERLQVGFDIQTEDFRLPVLTLQPIVENAVKYGVTRKEDGGMVWIKTIAEEDGYRIIVADDGVGFDPDKPNQDDRSHMGIANVRSRLTAMCGGELTVKSEPGHGTTVTIFIPIRNHIEKK